MVEERDKIKMKKKIFIIIGILLLIIVGGLLAFNSIKNIKMNQEMKAMIQEAEASGNTYLVIEINPKLMLILNKDNKVEGITKLNDDASIFKIEDFENLDFENAINKLIEVAKDNNYLKDDKKISVAFLTGNKDYVEQAKQYIIENDNGIKVSEVKKSKDELYKEIYKDSYEQFLIERERILEQWRKEQEEEEKRLEEERKAGRLQEIEDLKNKEKEYVDTLNELKSKGFSYNEELTISNGYDKEGWNVYSNDEGSRFVGIPSCSHIYVTKEECHSYCPHCIVCDFGN